MKRYSPSAFRGLSRGAAAGFLCVVFSAHSQAALTWDKDTIELKPEIGEEVMRTAYSFTNTGKTSVSVLAIKPSCGCVATNLEKFEYAPGETGTIKVTFDLGMDKGTPDADRTIKVVTSDAPDTPKVLELKAHVREAVTVSPESLVWRHGVPGEAKVVVVKAGSGVEAMQLVQTTQNDNFSVEMKPEAEGQGYRLTITPKSTAAPANASLDFDVKSPSIKRQVSCEIDLKVD